MVTLALLFIPSMTPEENAFRARKSLSRSSRCVRSVRANFFNGSILERMTWVYH